MSAIVRTRYGLLEGSRTADGAAASFKGIPYAQAPVGPLRWLPPRSPHAWVGTRPATEFGAACVQALIPDNSLVFGEERLVSEDCLYLNVYTASTDAAQKRPVIVWFHHGGFMMGWSGAPLYDGTALARAGAVVVTVNYRLGRLGFLAHPALSAESRHGTSGNYGLLDQIAALHWVRENIAAFGGDPDCVTIYGVSAGSFSVSALVATPLAKGLFHRAIGSSGGAFGPVSDCSEAGDFLQSHSAAEKTCADLMLSVGARTASELRELSAEKVLSAKNPQFWLARRGLLDTTYPILDGYVLPDSPAAIYASGKQNQVPLLTGSNANEASIVPFNQDSDTYLADSRAVFGDLFARYIELFPAGAGSRTALSSMAANSDRLFSWQNWAWARLHAKHDRHPVYYYNFAHEPPVPPGSVAEQALNPRVGAFHSAEIPYVFRNLEVRNWPWTQADRALSDTMSDYWLAFARSGDPNGGERPRWEPFEAARRGMLKLAGNAVFGAAPDSVRFAFWDEFYAGANASHDAALRAIAPSARSTALA